LWVGDFNNNPQVIKTMVDRAAHHLLSKCFRAVSKHKTFEFSVSLTLDTMEIRINDKMKRILIKLTIPT
jgi:hypothetical protein